MTKKEQARKYIEENHTVIILIAIFTLGVFLRFNGLTFQSYWIDEIFSADFADPSKSIEAMFQQIQYDAHPPLYIFLLRIVYQLFGYNELTGRAFSAVIGSLAVPAIYFLGKELFDKHVGLVAAFIASINYSLIYYSQETRSYSLVILFSSLSIAFFYKTLHEHTKKNILLYLFNTIILLHIHYIGFFLVGGQAFYFLFYFIKFQKNRINLIKVAISVSIILTVSVLPLAGNILMNTGREIYVKKTPSLFFVISYIHSYFENIYLFSLFAIAGFITLYSLFFSKEKNARERKNSIVFLLFCIISGFLFPYLKSILSHPMLGSHRYTITTLPAIIVLISYGLLKLDKWKIYIFIVAIIIFSSHALIKYYDNITKGQYREIVKEIEKHRGVAVYSVIPYSQDFKTNHYQTYVKLLGVNIDIINTEQLKRDIDKLPDCFWVLDAHFDLENRDDYGKHIKELKLDNSFYRSCSINLIGATAVLFSSYSDHSVCSRKIGL